MTQYRRNLLFTRGFGVAVAVSVLIATGWVAAVFCSAERDPRIRTVAASRGMPFRKAEYGVAFYGRVVDQDDKPVPGMTVYLFVDRVYTPTTDENGLFKIEGASGRYLSIAHRRSGPSGALEKPGYTLPPNGPGLHVRLCPGGAK